MPPRVRTSGWNTALDELDSRTPEAVASLAFKHFKNMVYARAVRILANPSEAEDVVQEVFILLHQKAGKFDEERTRTIPGWLTRATQYKLNNRSKKNHRRHLGTQELAEMITRSNAPLTAKEESALRTRQILQQLPDRQMKVFILKVMYGLTHAETAKELGVNEATVSRNFQAAKEELRLLAQGDGTAREILERIEDE